MSHSAWPGNWRLYVAGVIAFDTIAKLIAYEGRSELLLKWPNDILLAGEKVAGMLLENIGSTAENRSVVVIGTGDQSRQPP